MLDEIQDELKKDKSSVATALTSKILKDILPFLEIYPEGELEYRVELPIIIEEELVDEEGNPILPEDEPFNGSQADAIPDEVPQ